MTRIRILGLKKEKKRNYYSGPHLLGINAPGRIQSSEFAVALRHRSIPVVLRACAFISVRFLESQHSQFHLDGPFVVGDEESRVPVSPQSSHRFTVACNIRMSLTPPDVISADQPAPNKLAPVERRERTEPVTTTRGKGGGASLSDSKFSQAFFRACAFHPFHPFLAFLSSARNTEHPMNGMETDIRQN